VLKRSRGSRTDVDASYAALWTHLQKRYPRLHTVLITAASSRDDAAAAARELARAAVSLPNSVISAGESVDTTSHELETTPRTVTDSTGSVQIVDATRSSQAHVTASQGAGGVALTIVVAPPPQESAECVALAAAADATILVATRGSTKSRDARIAANLLRVADVEIAAALLLSKNGSRPRAATTVDSTVTGLPAAIEVPDGPPTVVGGRSREVS
jgi:Mrp family chromosome partitioning ATPase